MRHGGKILIDQLEIFGVDRVFSVPGESFLAALDGLHDSGIQNVVCRHEGGSAMMAEADGKMTGKPGIAFVTRGPGATNASAGVHVARQDSTPMILFVGQIAREHRDREVFQEVDYRAMFGPLAKWVAEIDQTDRIPEYVARAFAVATSGRPGPVVLALPEDMLSAEADVQDSKGPARLLSGDLGSAAHNCVDWLNQAERPLIVAGGPHWSKETGEDLANFAGNLRIPVALSFRRQDYIDNRHPSYCGDLNVGMNPALARIVTDADRVLILGSRFGDIETRSFELADPVTTSKRFFHVHADANEISHLWQADFNVTENAPRFIAALAAVQAKANRSTEWQQKARAAYEGWVVPKPTPGNVKMEQVVRWLSDQLPEQAIITNGAGNYAAWLHRYFEYKGFRTQLAPTSGSMGYGFPAAVAASLRHPDKTVVCFAGDGCFQMTLNEMSTAVQHGAKPIVIVVNNGQYGTIRMHQEKRFSNRVSGTALANPDFAALAFAYGGHGEVVMDQAQFPEAFARAEDFGGLAVIELRVDPEALTASQTLSDIRGT